jgi:hypothetical protein
MSVKPADPAPVADGVGGDHTLGGFFPVTGWVNVVRTDESPRRRAATAKATASTVVRLSA